MSTDEEKYRKTSLQLRFVVVGAGIGGLATAYALARAGHHVRVLEKYHSLGQRSGGVRIPPNLTKILVEWGLSDQLAKSAQSCNKLFFYALDTGENIGGVEWKEPVLKETGADFLLIHYDDLHRMLYDLAVSSGASVSFNSPVSSVFVDKNSNVPHVVLATGELLNPDVVIGADGYRSIVRDVVSQRDDDGVDSGMSAYTIVIPAELMKTDPELASLPDQPEWPMWMGTSRTVFGHPVHCGKDYNVTLFWPDNALKPTVDADIREGWDVSCPTDSLDLTGCTPKVQRLITLVPSALRTKFVKRAFVDEWFDQSRRLVLIGEAAHSILPCSMFCASLAVEDAAVLGTLFSRLRDWEQVPLFLHAYQELRQPRCNAVHLSELSNAALTWLPPGPERDLRNAHMRQSMQSKEHWDDKRLAQQWDEISETFGYSATEAAEAWWVNWGVLEESSKEVQAYEPLDLTFEMTEVLMPENAVMV